VVGSYSRVGAAGVSVRVLAALQVGLVGGVDGELAGAVVVGGEPGQPGGVALGQWLAGEGVVAGGGDLVGGGGESQFGAG
jgi:hypothetical protein